MTINKRPRIRIDGFTIRNRKSNSKAPGLGGIIAELLKIDERKIAKRVHEYQFRYYGILVCGWKIGTNLFSYQFTKMLALETAETNAKQTTLCFRKNY